MSRKLRIAVWHNLPSGGGKRALHQQLRGVLDRGHQVEAWRPPIPQDRFASIGELVEEHEVPLSIVPEGRSYIQKIVRHVVRPRRLISAMHEHCRLCAREIEAGRFDILFANTDMYFSMPFIGRHVDLPKLVYLGEPHRPLYEALPELPWIALPLETRRSWSFRALKRRARNRFDVALARLQAREELESARAFDRILVNSMFSRESALRAYGLEAEVCYPGVDTARFRDLALDRERFVIGLGTLGPTKDVKLAIWAIGRMARPRPPLVWVGNMTDDLYLEEALALARTLEVEFHPRVLIEDEELIRLLNTAAVMIYVPKLEPFGLAPLEANACGCPVVGVAEGGVRETIQDGVNGMLAARSPEALAEALGKLIDHPEEARKLGREARATVERRWSVESSIDRIEGALLRTVR